MNKQTAQQDTNPGSRDPSSPDASPGRGPSPVPRRRRALLAVAAVALLAVLIAAAFDWDWFRPAFTRYLTEQSGRDVRAEHMAIDWDAALNPTVTFRGVHIENAPWADTRSPMATAGLVSFTFSKRSLMDRRFVISKIVLREADVDLERQADGLRNWRLSSPDNRGAAHVKVLRVEAHDSRLRYADRSRNFDIRFAASDVPPVADVADKAQPTDKEPLRSRLTAQGRYLDTQFTAEAFTGAVLTLRETDETFPIRGHAMVAATRLDFDGRVADIVREPSAEGSMRLAGPTLSQLPTFVLRNPVRTGAYRLDAQLRRSDDEFHFSQLHGKIGRTDLSGEAAYARRQVAAPVAAKPGRLIWRADLRSESADIDDLRALVGIEEPASATAPATANAGTARGAAVKSSNAGRARRLFPQQPFHSGHLREQEAEVKYAAKRFHMAGFPAVDSLRFDAELAGGVLQVKHYDVGMAGGHAVGHFSLDARGNLPQAVLTSRLNGMRLERLIPKAPQQVGRAGPLKGELTLQGHGRSVAEVLGAATGKLAFEVDGGSISNKLDAKLSLNLGKMLSLAFKGDRDIALQCAVAVFDVHQGLGKTRALLVETEQTRIEGGGSINLRNEQIDLTLVPRPKNPGLLTLGSTIDVNGTFLQPDYSMNKGASGAVESNGAHCRA